MNCKLLDLMNDVAKKCYVPYSNFHVVSIFETINGELHYGFNVENVAYPNCMCAERVALYSYLQKGLNTKNIKIIHIYSPDSVDYLSPCGGCRQTLSEWINKDTIIKMYNKKGECIENTFENILPYYVDPKNIKGEK